MPAETLPPHGGQLVDLRCGSERAEEILTLLTEQPASRVVYKRLHDHHYWDLVLLAVGAYSPLVGYLGREDYRNVLSECRLSSGLLWSIPISLPLSREEYEAVTSQGAELVALVEPWRDLKGGAGTASPRPPEGLTTSTATLSDGAQSTRPQGETVSPLAVLELKEVFEVDVEAEAEAVFKTKDTRHPGVARLLEDGPYRAAGRVSVLRDLPPPYAGYPFTPAETRRAFSEAGWRTVVAFQTRNPIHRAHEYLCKCALEMVDGLLIHPVVGTTKDDDIPSDVRMTCYEVLVENYFPKDRVMIACLPAPMRYAGPREALHHALIRKNYGATHFIIGRDHAGVGSYYGTYEAQEFVSSFDPDELGLTPLFFEHAYYCRGCAQMATSKTCGHPDSYHEHLSGTKVRELLREGKALPETFSRPEVARVLAAAYGNGGPV